ncbi:MAG: Excisionase family binding protein [Actinomycetota bacterium]|nr:Excisionase family binding protein [Actinomycetota bacterium]
MIKTTAAPKRASASEHSLVSVSEAARLLGFSGMTVRRRIEARQFPAVKMGTKAMVPRAFVDAVLAAVHSGQTVIVEEFAETWIASTDPGERDPAQELPKSFTQWARSGFRPVGSSVSAVRL